jgi:translation elongation factor EF-G
MKDYLSLWAEGLPNQQSSRRLAAPITVLGEWMKQLGARGEFAKVELTVHPSKSFEVIDRVAERSELEKLGVEWPDCAIFGLLDVLMVTKSGPLYKVCVVLEKVWYHEVDSTYQAFRHAGRAAGQKIIERIEDDTEGSQLNLVPG